MNINEIKSYHIHIYYDDSTIEIAKRIGMEASKLFDLPLGNFHEKNVGPHPKWSVQLSVSKEKWGDALSWFALNREGLIIFAHPNTGDDLSDHRDRAIWMGKSLDLKLEIFH